MIGAAAGPSGRVHFTEVGPRDGLQNLSQPLPTAAKLELVEAVLDAGCDLVEATSFVSPQWVPQLADAEPLLAQLRERRGPEVMERVRVLVPNRRGLERALASGARRVLVNVGATDAFNQHNLNRSVEATLAEIGEVARGAESAGCGWDASLSVAFGCPYQGRVAPEAVVELARRLAELGAQEISVADTIGVADPAKVAELVAALGDAVPVERFALHLHDTRGMALANALAGHGAGVRRFEGSVGGVGGCPFAPRSTGNVCSEDLLYLFQRLGIESSVSVPRLGQAAKRLAELLGRELPGKLYRAGAWEPSPA